ncbi:MAG: PEP-CTERM sorting domain-containing protein [Verrucomicrobia bacterium]|nr:PEP-CTERM sorting domain-containing protein [Verrucomicrobiota bacterium]MCH8514507.1 PEP-CTERM sorting domain-containing protein [Kiritimatiellia bacterium]
MNLKSLFSTAALACATALAPLSASLIFYDGFLDGGESPTGAEYNTSGFAFIHNQDPTISPFNAPWDAGSNGTNENVGPRLQGGLSYSGAPASQGTALAMGRFGGSGARSETVSRTAEDDLTPASTAYYGSFMFNMNEAMFNAGSASTFRTQWYFQRENDPSATTRNLEIGVNGDNQLYIISRRNIVEGEATSTTAVMSGHTDTQLVVFQILDRTDPMNTHGATEQITAWLNPDMSLAPELWANPLTVEAPLLRTAGDNNLFNELSMSSSVGGVNQFLMVDEIRLATDWASIGAIPEPGTLMLVGIALGAVMLFRRRR